MEAAQAAASAVSLVAELRKELARMQAENLILSQERKGDASSSEAGLRPELQTAPWRSPKAEKAEAVGDRDRLKVELEMFTKVVEMLQSTGAAAELQHFQERREAAKAQLAKTKSPGTRLK